MTYAPAALAELGRYWAAQGGVNLGIVGDTSHQAKGVSYHLGADQLTAGAYSRKTTRDRAGLTNAASAIDLGRLHDSLGELRAFSTWLVDQARRDAPGTGDMREIIYSPDGSVVLRWDRERGYASRPQGGEADTSHLTHTHVSWYRDAQRHDHTTAFRPYFEEVPAMPGLQFRMLDRVNGIATVVGPGHALIRVDDQVHVPVAEGQAREVTSRIVLTAAGGHFPAGTVGYLVGNVPGVSPDQSVAAMLLEGDVTFVPDAIADDAVLVGRRLEWDRQAKEARTVVGLATRP